MSVNVPASLWRLKTLGGIPIKILSRNGSFGMENASATEEILIQASDLGAFVSEILPAPIIFMGMLIYPTRRRFPGAPWLVADTVTWTAFDDVKPIDPFGSDSGAPEDTYDKFLKVTINYVTSPQNDQDQDPNDPTTFLQVSTSAAGHYLHGELRGAVDEDGEEIREPDVPNMVTETIIEWNLVWPQIPGDFFRDTLMDRLRKAAGKVNSTVMRLFNDAPKHTLLFTSFDHQESYTWREGRIGKSPIQLTMKFTEKNFEDVDGKNITHDHYWIPSKGWKKITINGKDPYPETDFNNLFKPT